MPEDLSLFVPEQETRKTRRPRKPKQPPVETHKDYCYGGATQALAYLPRKKARYKEDRIAKTLTYEDNKLTVIVENSGNPLADSADRLLDSLVLQLTENNGLNCCAVKCAVTLPFDIYAYWRKAHNTKARQRLRDSIPPDLETLLSTHIRWQNENRKGKKRDVLNANILTSYVAFDQSKEAIQVNFTPEFTYYATHWFIGLYDIRLLALDRRHPYARPIGKKLQQLYYSKELRERGNHNFIKVETLLNSIPDMLDYGEVKARDRNYTRRIIKPFTSNLNALLKANILTGWKYLDADQKPIQAQQVESMNYEIFSRCYLTWEAPEPSSFGTYLASLAEG